jgi:hypothetical protein
MTMKANAPSSIPKIPESNEIVDTGTLPENMADFSSDVLGQTVCTIVAATRNLLSPADQHLVDHGHRGPARQPPDAVWPVVD